MDLTEARKVLELIEATKQLLSPSHKENIHTDDCIHHTFEWHECRCYGFQRLVDALKALEGRS